VCDEYSFDVGQVGRVDSWNCESVWLISIMASEGDMVT